MSGEEKEIISKVKSVIEKMVKDLTREQPKDIVRKYK